MKRANTYTFCLLIFLVACNSASETETAIWQDTTNSNINAKDIITVLPASVTDTTAITDSIVNVDFEIRERLVNFAETLIGVPYEYAGTDPKAGFDCSGFITYVFNHFHLEVPRSSVDFTNVGKEVRLENSRRGDLILFTGTDSSDRTVGHMGIITTRENGKVAFIHSTSGKRYSVTITPLNDYYKGRFVKVITVFDEKGKFML